MINVVLLDATQADIVRGPSSVDPLAVLAPVALNDGGFYLGEAVLSDPVHAEHFDLLSGCPLVDFTSIVDRLPTPEE